MRNMENFEKVLIALRQIMRVTDMSSKRIAAATGLTLPQFLLLQAIQELGEVTIGRLAQEMNLTQATVTSILNRLEFHGYAFRERNLKDKRIVHARLTGKGRDALQGAPAVLQGEFGDRFGALKDWEQMSIVAALQRTAEMMNAESLDASPVLYFGDIKEK